MRIRHGRQDMQHSKPDPVFLANKKLSRKSDFNEAMDGCVCAGADDFEAILLRRRESKEREGDWEGLPKKPEQKKQAQDHIDFGF